MKKNRIHIGERRPPHCLRECPNFEGGKCLFRSSTPGENSPFVFQFVSMAVSRLAFPTLLVPSLFVVSHSAKNLTAYQAMSKSTFLQWVVKIEAHVNFPERHSFFSSRSLLVSRLFSEGNGLTFNRDELLGLLWVLGREWVSFVWAQEAFKMGNSHFFPCQSLSLSINLHEANETKKFKLSQIALLVLSGVN